MGSAKDLIIRPITSAEARATVTRLHYSGKVVNNSQIHMGVFWEGRLEGALQFGPSLDKRKTQGLVEGTGWNDFIELNRMAFSERLPRNSESRALGVALRLLRKHAPHLQWVISFADATQCGDGTIYRASGFVLTGIKRNSQTLRLADGSVVTNFTLTKGEALKASGGAAKAPAGAQPLDGYQFRYVYFLDPAARGRLTVPVIPFDQIPPECRMYRGQAMRPKQATPGDHPDGGGAAPTRTLHLPDEAT